MIYSFVITVQIVLQTALNEKPYLTSILVNICHVGGSNVTLLVVYDGISPVGKNSSFNNENFYALICQLNHIDVVFTFYGY